MYVVWCVYLSVIDPLSVSIFTMSLEIQRDVFIFFMVGQEYGFCIYDFSSHFKRNWNSSQNQNPYLLMHTWTLASTLFLFLIYLYVCRQRSTTDVYMWTETVQQRQHWGANGGRLTEWLFIRGPAWGKKLFSSQREVIFVLMLPHQRHTVQKEKKS